MQLCVYYTTKCSMPATSSRLKGQLLLLPGWALAVVSSRAFRLRGLSQPATLLPLIDMANHSFAPNAEVVLVGDGAVLRATQQVRQAGHPGGCLRHAFAFQQQGRSRPCPCVHHIMCRVHV
jgi:hypothetical protein